MGPTYTSLALWQLRRAARTRSILPNPYGVLRGFDSRRLHHPTKSGRRFASTMATSSGSLSPAVAADAGKAGIGGERRLVSDTDSPVGCSLIGVVGSSNLDAR